VQTGFGPFVSVFLTTQKWTQIDIGLVLSIAGVVTITNLAFGSLAGYAFARLRFPGREVLFLIVLATLMIPDQLRLVPVYLIMNGIGLTRGPGQYLAVVLTMASSACDRSGTTVNP